MKKQAVKKEPPPASPLGKAKRLDALAARSPLPDLTALPDNEARYAAMMHRLLLRYWHRTLSRDELLASRRMMVQHLLMTPLFTETMARWTGKGDNLCPQWSRTLHGEKGERH